MMGNRWADYSGEGEYAIDGDGEAMDKYPMQLSQDVPKEPEEPIESRSGISGYPIEAIVLGLVLLGIIIKQADS